MQTSNDQQAQLAELWRQVELLGSDDYRIVGAAHDCLVAAGHGGMEAVLQGLSHVNPRVRRGCADFLDHNGDDRCVLALSEALHDPVPYVRRQAVHSLSCQRCKASPLQVDAVAQLIAAAQSDSSIRVRREAVSGLSMQPRDVRVIPVLQALLRQETDRMLRKLAHHALKRHDPTYREAVAAAARERKLARAETATG